MDMRHATPFRWERNRDITYLTVERGDVLLDAILGRHLVGWGWMVLMI